MLRVLFAPDWRSGVGYQGLLAEALATRNVKIEWLSEYRRILPLARSVPGFGCDLLHLHWPEAYYTPRGDLFDPLRNARFPLDLILATRNVPFVVTAHNLHAHNRAGEKAARRNAAFCYRRAAAVFAHSRAAKDRLMQEYGIREERVSIIPVGDLAKTALPPIGKANALAQLGISPEKLCLMFGTVEPYKGIEEIIENWSIHQPAADLYIVGRPVSEEYGRQIESLAAKVPMIHTRLSWVSDDELHLWLSAADCTIFNYQTILTSGAAPLARSLGIPILIPARLTTVDLMEPDARVFRFNPDNFITQLNAALRIVPSWEAASAWREAISWDRIAALTANVYRAVLGSH